MFTLPALIASSAWFRALPFLKLQWKAEVQDYGQVTMPCQDSWTSYAALMVDIGFEISDRGSRLMRSAEAWVCGRATL